MAHVADGKDTRNIGLKQEWISIKSPALRSLSITYEIGSGQKEAAFIALHQIVEPIGARQSAYKDEHGAGWHTLYFVAIGTQDRNLLEMRVAMRLGNAGIGP